MVAMNAKEVAPHKQIPSGKALCHVAYCEFDEFWNDGASLPGSRAVHRRSLRRDFLWM
jgi:hypothetical protein